MQEEHHDTDYEQDVNETAGNVKGQEPKQPKNNQNRRDESKHVFNSFTSERVPIRIPVIAHSAITISHWIRALDHKAARSGIRNLSDITHALKVNLNAMFGVEHL
jgi:hypothetical protein